MNDDVSCLMPTACCCDVAGLVCALPSLCICSLCEGGPYAFEHVPPLHGTKTHPLDRWYRSAIHTVHGGSLLQLLATHAAYWRFPYVRDHGKHTVHRIHVAPRTRFGACCFVPLVNTADPHFRIRKEQDGTLTVRLTAKPCGCGRSVDCSAFALTDVWRVSPDGRFIRSMKTRNHCRCCGALCVTGVGTGPAFFVAADDVPSAPQILVALRD